MLGLFWGSCWSHPMPRESMSKKSGRSDSISATSAIEARRKSHHAKHAAGDAKQARGETPRKVKRHTRDTDRALHDAGKRAALRIGGSDFMAPLKDWAARHKLRLDRHLVRAWAAGWTAGTDEAAEADAAVSSPTSSSSWTSSIASAARSIGGAAMSAGRKVGQLYGRLPTSTKLAAAAGVAGLLGHAGIGKLIQDYGGYALGSATHHRRDQTDQSNPRTQTQRQQYDAMYGHLTDDQAARMWYVKARRVAEDQAAWNASVWNDTQARLARGEPAEPGTVGDEWLHRAWITGLRELRALHENAPDGSAAKAWAGAYRVTSRDAASRSAASRRAIRQAATARPAARDAVSSVAQRTRAALARRR